MKKTPIYLIFFLLFSACVSVQMPTSKGMKSKSIIFTAPNKPFQSSENKIMDAVWINDKNGNTISYQSECESKNEPTMEQLENDTVLSLQEISDKKSEMITYNQRNALASHISGTLDGVKVKIRQVSFLKNNCSYVINYFGVDSKFALDEKQFDIFLKDFKVQ